VDDKQVTEAIHEDVQQLNLAMSTIKDDVGQIKDLIKAGKPTDVAPVDLEAMQKMIQATLIKEIKNLNGPKEASAARMHPWEVNVREIKFDTETDDLTGGEIRVELGRGGFGSVYKGTFRGKAVAIKLMNACNSHTETAFKKETNIMFRLHHLHIVGCFGGCIHKDNLCLLMPLMKHNLATVIAGKELKREEKQLISEHAANGLAYLHCVGVIHHDIKPANCMENEQGVWKLTDFGLASSKSSMMTFGGSMSKGGSEKGTVGYMAPEKYSDKKCPSEPSLDVFAFGMVLFELWSQTAPFKDLSSAEIIDKTQTTDPTCTTWSPTFCRIPLPENALLPVSIPLR
jgi:predicted Ser/Thr protein kinase